MFRSCQIIIRELCSLQKLYCSIHISIRICKCGSISCCVGMRCGVVARCSLCVGMCCGVVARCALCVGMCCGVVARCASYDAHLATTNLTPSLEKITGLQLVKKFPTFHGTRLFITALTSVRQLSLSWASPIQSIYLHPTSWRSILILSTHLSLGLPSSLFRFLFPTKTLQTLHSKIYA